MALARTRHQLYNKHHHHHHHHHHYTAINTLAAELLHGNSTSVHYPTFNIIIQCTSYSSSSMMVNLLTLTVGTSIVCRASILRDVFRLSYPSLDNPHSKCVNNH